MKTQEQLDLQTQLTKKQLEFYTLINFVISLVIVGSVIYGIYAIIMKFWG